jgi:hypothetical protein
MTENLENESAHTNFQLVALLLNAVLRSKIVFWLTALQTADKEGKQRLETCTRNYTSDWSSTVVSYISKSMNNISGEAWDLATASPKLSRVDRIFAVTSAKQFSFKDSITQFPFSSKKQLYLFKK